ncbi:MAG: ATP-binding cassette domain-containing protein [Actinobacteria bacterium]|nr:ATP-binding cassette domain-containing protein [Actinomycetota bacterium]MCL5887680.1 ATP-binding cassette domain-containing protein [Actinomycetota bacterium]
MDRGLTVDGLGFSYSGREWVLRDVCLTAAPGEAVAVIGPSGAGKSTLFRSLARLARPSAGRVLLDGADLYAAERARGFKGAIGYVHQQHGLPTTISGAMAVIGGEMHAWGPAKVIASVLLGPTGAELERVAEVLGRVGLEGREHDRIGELSVGQRQRVAVARTLLQSPRLIIADEPVASVDPATADIILGLLAAEAQRGAIVLCSVHDVEKARRHFPRIVALRDGQVCFDGAQDTLSEEIVGQVYGSGRAA